MKLSSLLFMAVLGASCGKPLQITSEESKSAKGGKVINRIAFFQEGSKDIWMMHQRDEKTTEWDRLAIVVDKKVKPHTARFYQFKPGPLEWKENLPQEPYRVSCFLCHPNGPRAIRPIEGTQTLAEKSKTLMWNLRIKSYGRVVPHSSHADEDRTLVRPFRVAHPLENETLKLQSCTLCHKEDGLFARGSLTRQNALTIKHMVKSGHMPPWPVKMSKKEKQQLEMFLVGF